MNRILKPLLPSFFILLIVLFALPQENSLDTLISSLLVLTWGYYIFMVGIPSWNFSKDSLLRNPLFVILTVILIPFLLLIAAGSSLGNLWLVLLYYLLPAILFSLPQFVNEDTLSGYRSVILIVSNILGAAIIWIGFDHRHTTVLFDGFVDMGYVMNSFWMAAVILATFGQYSGVVRTDNDRDHGLMPTRYGNKIANVATPLASLIVIPFGLLTGF
ncbi:MAG: hypothetical protein ACXAE3_14730, partial [Candidatus Kariarchaeaceae archaeon]